MNQNIRPFSINYYTIYCILFGQIITTPIFFIKETISGQKIDEGLILGIISTFIWFLTIQFTIKHFIAARLYVQPPSKTGMSFISLYNLVKRQRKSYVYLAAAGVAAFLVSMMIVPSIILSSALDGLPIVFTRNAGVTSNFFGISMFILLGSFFIQRHYGIKAEILFFISIFFYFIIIIMVSLKQIGNQLTIFRAFNPYYIYNLFSHNKYAFSNYGILILSIAGVDLIHTGIGRFRKNKVIINWLWIKLILTLSVLGQGAYILEKYRNKTIITGNSHVTTGRTTLNHLIVDNPFYEMMPKWLIIPATIITILMAGNLLNALARTAFSIVSGAIQADLWPKLTKSYKFVYDKEPTLPGFIHLFFFGCAIMLAANLFMPVIYGYGLIIGFSLICTTSLLFALSFAKRDKKIVKVILFVYLVLEGCILTGIILPFKYSNLLTLIILAALFFFMVLFYKAKKITRRYVELVRFHHYVEHIEEMSHDRTIPKTSTHLVLQTSAINPKEIEHRIVWTLLNSNPLRADIYWLIYLDVIDSPSIKEYTVMEIIPNKIIRLEFRLGYDIKPEIDKLFQSVLSELIRLQQVTIPAQTKLNRKRRITGDIQFVSIKRILAEQNYLPPSEWVMLMLYFLFKQEIADNVIEIKESDVLVKYFPLIIEPATNLNLVRVDG